MVSYIADDDLYEKNWKKENLQKENHKKLFKKFKLKLHWHTDGKQYVYNVWLDEHMSQKSSMKISVVYL